MHEFDYFDNESYQKNTMIILALMLYIGILIEFIIIFRGDIEVYKKYNFDKEYKWNNTHTFMTFLRMLFMYVTYFPSNLNYLFEIGKSSLFVFVLLKYFLSNFIIGLYLVLIARVLMRLFRLTNEKYFEDVDQFNYS